MSNTSFLTTAIGWTVVFGAAGAIWAYNNTKSKNKSKPQAVAKQANKAVEDRKVPKSKKSKKDGGLSSDQDKKPSSKTQKKKTPAPQKTEPKQDTVKPVTNDSDVDDDDEVENNRKFALQFAKTQAGTTFSGKSSTTANRQKSVKQSRAQEKALKDSGNITAGDADDDQSFTDSPEVGPTSITSPVTSGIADMLEPAAPGPSVLKVTQPTNPKPAKKEKAKAAPQPVETKKQRQNRAKVEAARQLREEEEKERKVKEENQRRAAREAEGRAAKDGSQFMASQKSADSAWTASAANKSNTAAANNGKIDLLDTTEDKKNNKVKVAAPAESFSGSEVAGSEWQRYGDDDERVKTAIEDSREWEQVLNKKKRTKKEKKESTDVEGAGTTSSTDEKEYTAPPKTERSAPGTKWVSQLTHVDKNGSVHEKSVELQDAEWEVS